MVETQDTQNYTTTTTKTTKKKIKEAKKTSETATPAKRTGKAPCTSMRYAYTVQKTIKEDLQAQRRIGDALRKAIQESKVRVPERKDLIQIQRKTTLYQTVHPHQKAMVSCKTTQRKSHCKVTRKIPSIQAYTWNTSL